MDSTTAHESPPEHDSLLSHIAQRHVHGYEDIATDALSFILNRSEACRRALSEFLAQGDSPIPITHTQPWTADTYGAIPDLACFDRDELSALIEVKFWAPLTPHQPVTYWNSLPAGRPTALMFVAPTYRTEQDDLWSTLTRRLREAGVQLMEGAIADQHNSIDGSRFTAAESFDDHRQLILASWSTIIGRLTERARQANDTNAMFHLRELHGLTTDAENGVDGTLDPERRNIVRDAITRLVTAGWANIDGLSVGNGYDYHVRFLRLANAYAWLGIHYTALKQIPDVPLWLGFMPANQPMMDFNTVKERLSELVQGPFDWSRRDYLVAIRLPESGDRKFLTDAVVEQVRSIASRLNPDGPTYS